MDYINDDRLRRLTKEALRLYEGFDELYHGHLVEAVMRHLPPDFDRAQVERVVSEVAPQAQ